MIGSLRLVLIQILLWGGMLAVCSSTAKAQPEASDVNTFARSIFKNRFAECGGKTYVFYGIAAGAPQDSLPRPMLLEVRELQQSARNIGLSEADKLNGIQWRGEMSIQFKLYRSWNETMKSWSTWANGMPTIWGNAISTTIAKQSGRVVIDKEHTFNVTIQPITCAAVSKLVEGTVPATTSPRDAVIPRPTQPVDTAGTAIQASGFVGLRVGHSRADAERFFGEPLREIKLCGYTTLPNRTFLETTSGDLVQVMLWRDQIVAFRVSTAGFRTRSGLRVGDEQAKVLQLYGRDPTFDKRNEVTDSHSTTPGVALYYVGQINTLLAIVINNKVASMVFGAGMHIGELEDRCFRKASTTQAVPQQQPQDQGSRSQRWAYFCTDDQPGSGFNTCSSEVLSVDVPWTGRNLDRDSQRTPDSDEFSRLLPAFKAQADAACKAKGFLRASDGWPLRAFMDSWYRTCRIHR